MPDNSVYYHAAYVTAAIIFGAHALTIWLRWRALGPGPTGGGAP